MKLISLFVSLSALFCLAFAQNCQDAFIFNEKLVQRAESGDAESQWQLGECYRLGNGVEQNWETAVFWYRKSAEQQFLPSIHAYSVCLYKGLGVKQDVDKAEELAKIGVDKGFSKSCNLLGIIYLYSGVEANYNRAFALFQEAVKQGDACIAPPEVGNYWQVGEEDGLPEGGAGRYACRVTTGVPPGVCRGLYGMRGMPCRCAPFVYHGAGVSVRVCSSSATRLRAVS